MVFLLEWLSVLLNLWKLLRLSSIMENWVFSVEEISILIWVFRKVWFGKLVILLCKVWCINCCLVFCRCNMVLCCDCNVLYFCLCLEFMWFVNFRESNNVFIVVSIKIVLFVIELDGKMVSKLRVYRNMSINNIVYFSKKNFVGCEFFF